MFEWQHIISLTQPCIWTCGGLISTTFHLIRQISSNQWLLHQMMAQEQRGPGPLALGMMSQHILKANERPGTKYGTTMKIRTVSATGRSVYIESSRVPGHPPLDGTHNVPEIFSHHAIHSPNHAPCIYAEASIHTVPLNEAKQINSLLVIVVVHRTSP